MDSFILTHTYLVHMECEICFNVAPMVRHAWRFSCSIRTVKPHFALWHLPLVSHHWSHKNQVRFSNTGVVFQIVSHLETSPGDAMSGQNVPHLTFESRSRESP